MNPKGHVAGRRSRLDAVLKQDRQEPEFFTSFAHPDAPNFSNFQQSNFSKEKP